MDIQLDRRFRNDFLTRRLYLDCTRMRVNVALFQLLRMFKTQAVIVLATDNMDCFANTFNHARGRRRRLTAESETLADWATICDDLICSSNIAALKAEDPQRFFGTWLTQHGLDFRDAALIDDRADNCQAFAHCGGTPIQYKMTTNDLSEVATALKTWLEPTQRPATSRAARGSPGDQP